MISDFGNPLYNSGGWQRIQHMPRTEQAYVLPEHCVQTYKCGTQHPIWLSESHPHGEILTFFDEQWNNKPIQLYLNSFAP